MLHGCATRLERPKMDSMYNTRRFIWLREEKALKTGRMYSLLSTADTMIQADHYVVIHAEHPWGSCKPADWKRKWGRVQEDRYLPEMMKYSVCWSNTNHTTVYPVHLPLFTTVPTWMRGVIRNDISLLSQFIVAITQNEWPCHSG